MKSLYRNITIEYQKIAVDCQVPCTQIVSYYFDSPFKQIHNDFFSKEAKRRSIQITPLFELQHYDIRLNSLKPQASVKSAQLEFGAYDPKKRLIFYVMEEKKAVVAVAEEEKQEEGIEFELISGGSVEKTQTLMIKGMTYDQLQKKIRGIFGIEQSQLIQLIHCGEIRAIKIERNEEPYKRFQRQRLKKVGIKRVYSAG